MISAFVSREFGFGMKLSAEQLAIINVFRRQPTNRMYRDEEAAVKKLGKQEKEDMKESPFIVQFEYGANGEGYWTYESMIIQLEDCIDVVSALYPEYDFIFQFDHSCGHDRKRLDGLNSNTVKKGYSDGRSITQK
jgi:hypothetical protein